MTFLHISWYGSVLNDGDFCPWESCISLWDELNAKLGYIGDIVDSAVVTAFMLYTEYSEHVHHSVYSFFHFHYFEKVFFDVNVFFEIVP